MISLVEKLQKVVKLKIWNVFSQFKKFNIVHNFEKNNIAFILKGKVDAVSLKIML